MLVLCMLLAMLIEHRFGLKIFLYMLENINIDVISSYVHSGIFGSWYVLCAWTLCSCSMHIAATMKQQ